jgi:hypothetical protein
MFSLIKNEELGDQKPAVCKSAREYPGVGDSSINVVWLSPYNRSMPQRGRTNSLEGGVAESASTSMLDPPN